jgi:hypothetical protein
VRSEEFGKLIADALEVGAQAHPVKVEYNRLMDRTTIHVLDKDEVLWRVQIEEPR